MKRLFGRKQDYRRGDIFKVNKMRTSLDWYVLRRQGNQGNYAHYGYYNQFGLIYCRGSYRLSTER